MSVSSSSGSSSNSVNDSPTDIVLASIKRMESLVVPASLKRLESLVALGTCERWTIVANDAHTKSIDVEVLIKTGAELMRDVQSSSFDAYNSHWNTAHRDQQLTRQRMNPNATGCK